MARKDRRSRKYKKRNIKIIVAVLVVIAMYSLANLLFAGSCNELKSENQIHRNRFLEVDTERRDCFMADVAQREQMTLDDCGNEQASDAISEMVPLGQDMQIYASELCESYSVPYTLVLAVIEAESTFKCDAVNGSCYGYMQISDINLEWLNKRIGIDDLQDPAQNLYSGIYILADLYGKYKDWDKVLVCYNYGETGAYERVFSKGLTDTAYSRKVREYERRGDEVLGGEEKPL